MDDGPQSLAEAITEGHGECPIPQTHDRLEECHHWWHEMATTYHEPDAFRWRLGAFLSAARSVTFILQAEKGAFADFGWYDDWRVAAGSDPLLKWLNENRRLHTHQRSIAPTSWATFRCLFEHDDPRFVADEDREEEWQGPLDIVLNPYRCTHYYLRTAIPEDHPHQYTRYWEAQDLPGQELLEVCASIHDRLADVVEIAHRHLGARMGTARRSDREWLPESGSHHLPCMNDTESHRVVVTRLDENGEQIWDDAPPHVG